MKRWSWFGLIVEASKPFVGMTFGLAAVTDSLHSAVSEIHGDLVAHYNWLRGQDAFATEVIDALEGLPEVEHGEP